MGSNRIRRRVSTFKPDRLRPVALRPFDEELRIERKPPPGSTSSFTIQPSIPLRVELWVDRAIKRVGEIYTFAVAVISTICGPAVEMAVRCRMRSPARRSPPILDLSDELRSEGVGDVNCRRSPVPQQET